MTKMPAEAEPVHGAKIGSALRGRRHPADCAHCAAKRKQTKHGHYSHGRRTPIYITWQALIARCTNPQRNRWKSYGGRGITVCERWTVFENFLADMGERPPGTSIDRIDNDGNYEPGNCRWATRGEQERNKRRKKLLG